MHVAERNRRQAWFRGLIHKALPANARRHDMRGGIREAQRGQKMKQGLGRSVAFIAVLACVVAYCSAPCFAAPTSIVVLGDSLTAGYGLKPGESFPAQLQAALAAKGQSITVINAGLSGDTAAGGLQRFDWSVPKTADGLILELGANDALRGLDPKKTEDALAAILDKAKARGLPVLLAGMEAPRNLGKIYDAQFHAIYQDLAKRYDVIFYPFFLKGVALNPALTQADGMHPTAKGVAVIVTGIMPSVEALLAKVKTK